MAVAAMLKVGQTWGKTQCLYGNPTDFERSFIFSGLLLD